MKSTKKKFESFPPQIGAYKVELKGRSVWRNFDTVALSISVGRSVHEGAKFEALCLWVNERFDNVVINVSDSLQRHNIMFEEGISEDFALHKSIKAGDEWLKRNMHSLNILPDKNITRWESFRLNPEFEERLKLADSLYHSNEQFRLDVQNQAYRVFCRKHKGKPTEGEFFEGFIRSSVRYIIEETAVFAIRDRDVKSITIYPGTFMHIWDQFKGNPVKGLEALSTRVYNSVDFSRNKSFQVNCNENLKKVS